MVVEHLNRDALLGLLLSREKPAMSVLQRFVNTRSGYNHLIQSVFTPDSCMLRKCVNSFPSSDAAMVVPQRTVTFELDSQDIQPRDISNRETREQIEQIHVEMSNHLGKIVGKEVSRSVSYFKVGADNRIYFQWATMMSFETAPRTFAKHFRLALSSQDRLLLSIKGLPTHTSKTRSSTQCSHSHSRVCPSCERHFTRDEVVFLVSVKALLASCYPQEAMSELGTSGVLIKVLGQARAEKLKDINQDRSVLYVLHGIANPQEADRITPLQLPNYLCLSRVC
ncbi:hypothetical protein PINS_up003544 [Pythium insidiosum]|nr:hypothetical protein PINS_up003544 [Pythium insidiosum]